MRDEADRFPWYEIVSGDGLMQGDILRAMPTVRPPSNMTWPPVDEAGAAQIFPLVTAQDLVVMTQSCDLVAGQKRDVEFIALCPVIEVEAAASANPEWRNTVNLEEIRQGRRPAYHMLGGGGTEELRRGVSVVSFREVWSLPLPLTRRLAEEQGPRLRLHSPYREHLSQSFARYFMRVGLPTDIPSFAGAEDEAKASRYLRALAPEARDRAIAAAEG